jgi:hypothetical protein
LKYKYSVHYRCTCTGPDGKLLGSSKTSGCRKLWRADGSWYAKHGSAGIVMRVPTGTGIRTLKRSGYTSKAAAEAAGDRVVELLALASDEITARKIGDMIMAAKRGAELPAVEDVRRRLMLGQAPDMTGETVGEFLDGWLAGKSAPSAHRRLAATPATSATTSARQSATSSWRRSAPRMSRLCWPPWTSPLVPGTAWWPPCAPR